MFLVTWLVLSVFSSSPAHAIYGGYGKCDELFTRGPEGPKLEWSIPNSEDLLTEGILGRHELAMVQVPGVLQYNLLSFSETNIEAVKSIVHELVEEISSEFGATFQITPIAVRYLKIEFYSPSVEVRFAVYSKFKKQFTELIGLKPDRNLQNIRSQKAMIDALHNNSYSRITDLRFNNALKKALEFLGFNLLNPEFIFFNQAFLAPEQNVMTVFKTTPNYRILSRGLSDELISNFLMDRRQIFLQAIDDALTGMSLSLPLDMSIDRTRRNKLIGSLAGGADTDNFTYAREVPTMADPGLYQVLKNLDVPVEDLFNNQYGRHIRPYSRFRRR